MTPIRRTITPEIRVLDSKVGLAEYVASDETIDSYREIIRADGWRFTRFEKNAPFVYSHEYGEIDRLLGRVVDFKVAGGKLIETVKWAVDVAENTLAQLGWKMTQAGYLKAVSVGFMPLRMVSKGDGPPFAKELQRLNLKPDTNVRAIYLEQEQLELSACIIGANPNALAKSYKAGVITDADLDFISVVRNSPCDTDVPAFAPVGAASSKQQARVNFFDELQRRLERL